MKARRRLVLVSVCVLLFVAAVAVVVLLHKRAAPEPVRLLPDAEAVLYVDFATVRTLTGLDKRPLPGLAADYDEFVRQTGFAFERDLDEVAVAVHGGNGERERRYSEVITGRFNQSKLSQYLRKHTGSVESYRDTDVFTVPVEDHTLRVALLALDTVAISNVDSPAVMHGIIDRFHKAALPFGGPKLVRTYYPKVPVGSLLWAVARLGKSEDAPGEDTSIPLPGGLALAAPAQSDVVLSVRPLNRIEAQADFYSENKEALHNFTSQMDALLGVVRGMANAEEGGADPDMKALLDSLQITLQDDHAELKASIPPNLLRKLVSESAVEAGEANTAED
jgi:hypothetical protein